MVYPQLKQTAGCSPRQKVAPLSSRRFQAELRLPGKARGFGCVSQADRDLSGSRQHPALHIEESKDKCESPPATARAGVLEG